MLRRINLIEYIQNPYNDTHLQRFESAGRRNWAVKSGISVKEFFIFSKGSELIFALPETLQSEAFDVGFVDPNFRINRRLNVF